MDELKAGGLIAFSDPAGAKACLGLAECLRQVGRPASAVICNREYPFFGIYGGSIRVDPGFKLAQDYPWCFVGTSHPDSSLGFELKILEQAKSRDIPSYAYVDHSTSIELRFILGQRQILPQEIWFVDEASLTQATFGGPGTSRLRVVENPYFTYLRNYWKPLQNLREMLDPSGSLPANLLLYVPDPISLRNKGQWAFDECTVVQQLLSWLELHVGAGMVVKPHPLQPPNLHKLVLEKCSPALAQRVLWIEEFDPVVLATIACAVIGFHSNALREIDCLGIPVLRYFPANLELDALGHTNIGRRVESWSRLTEELDFCIT